MGKFNYSVTRTKTIPPYEQETLQVVECNSFDEAIKIVDRAVHDRMLDEQHQSAQDGKRNPPPGDIGVL